ncbi:hypothetical protein EDD11_006608 [Mortierella claussenii]|nr:hypothetical protein EDD11_006608 [Mortierella claussenii]
MKASAILSALSAIAVASAGTFHDPALDKDASSFNTVTSPSGSLGRGFIIEYEDGVLHPNAFMSLQASQVDYEIRNQYSVFNGAAISVHSEHDGQDLASIPGIKNVWPIRMYRIPKTQPTDAKATDPKVASYHQMTGVDVVHQQYKLTGKGVKIGVIDTGIDYTHPAFALPGASQGCFGKECRVAYGWDFVGDAYTGEGIPVPGPDPMDCQGHGTHVAGIIGANALNVTALTPKPPQPFVGVAPEVTLGAYRVFGCNGTAGDDVIMAAMERAFADGMDVINMSLGGGSSYKSNPQAVLGDRLVAKGMALAAAAGNDGDQGVWMVSDTGLGDLSSSVASFDNIYGYYSYFTYSNKTFLYTPSEAYAKPIELPANITLIPVLEANGTLSDGCDPAVYKGLDVKDKIVLTLGDVTRCKSGGRGTLAAKAGAAAILIQTTPIGLASLGGIPDFPMASIEHQAGEDLLAAYKEDPKTTFTWSKKPRTFLVEGGGEPSGFSSLGVDGDLRLKPDLAAPGGNILSTFPLKKTGYAVLSGTSMATPYTAGSHALYIEYKKTKPRGDEIRQVFKNTATIYKAKNSTAWTSAAKQGAGLINVLNALKTQASITPDHIDLLDSKHLQRTVQITITNYGNKTETYTMSHAPADALNSYPKNNKFPLPTPIIESDYAAVSFSNSKVTIPAGKSAQLTLRFSEPKAGQSTQWPLYSGYIIATPSFGGKDAVAVHVPYLGLKGDLSQVPIMDTDLKFPALMALDVASGNLTKVSNEGDVLFDLQTKIPVVQTRLGSHTPSGEIRLYDDKDVFQGYMFTATATAVGPQGRQKNVDDNGLIAFTNWAWEGMVMKEAKGTKPVALAAGVYRVVVANQRKMTQGQYPQDYEVFELGKIQI